MKIFVAGNRGQLGSDCMEILSAEHAVRGMDLPELDIADPQGRAQALGDGPEAIVNCAAFTRVDACETEREAALRVNAAGPRCLADHAARHGALLVHVSTDYVFDGRREPPLPYTEQDPTGPLSWYGETKRQGERAVMQSGCRYAILRTAWLYGFRGKNFLKTMLRLALRPEGDDIKVVNDQYGSPTWSRRLARQIGAVLDTGATGLFHATAEGYCTWFELARTFLEAMRIDHRLVPCTTEEYDTAAVRPRNGILENSALKAAGLHVMRDWKEDVREFAAMYRETLIEEARASWA